MVATPVPLTSADDHVTLVDGSRVPSAWTSVALYRTVVPTFTVRLPGVTSTEVTSPWVTVTSALPLTSPAVLTMSAKTAPGPPVCAVASPSAATLTLEFNELHVTLPVMSKL